MVGPQMPRQSVEMPLRWPQQAVGGRRRRRSSSNTMATTTTSTSYTFRRLAVKYCVFFHSLSFSLSFSPSLSSPLLACFPCCPLHLHNFLSVLCYLFAFPICVCTHWHSLSTSPSRTPTTCVRVCWICPLVMFDLQFRTINVEAQSANPRNCQ